VTVGRYDIEITADIITIFEKINSESRKGTWLIDYFGQRHPPF
jgi:hypothetical protein